MRPSSILSSRQSSLKTRQIDGITILDLGGRLLLNDGMAELNSALKAAAANKSLLALNFAAVTDIDSSTTGSLVGAHVTMGKRLVLYAVSEQPEVLFRQTMLDTVLNIYPDENSALASFLEPQMPGSAPLRKIETTPVVIPKV